MLLRKMGRDLIQSKIQFISIFIMVFLGAFIYSGINSQWYGMQLTSKKYYAQTNAADFWLQTSNSDAQALKTLEGIDDITAVEQRLTLPGTTTLSSNPTVALNFISSNKISKAYRKSGKSFDLKSKGVWVDNDFAKEHHLKLNNTLKLISNGLIFKVKIEGFILSPDYVYFLNGAEIVPNHKKFGFVYLSKAILPAQLKDNYSHILLRSKTSDSSKITREINKSKLKYQSILSRKNHSSYLNLNEKIKQQQVMGTIFPLAFLLIAIFSVATTMTRLIMQQRLVISTLKALGFKRRKIYFHYLSYTFLLSLIAALSGSLLGFYLLPPLFQPQMQRIFKVPDMLASFTPTFLVLPLTLVVICTVLSYFVMRSSLNERPAIGMRPKVIEILKQNWFEKTSFWKKLNFSIKWNTRDIIKNKTRTFMAIFGIAGCAAILLCAIALKSSIEDMSNWRFKQIEQYSSKVLLYENTTTKQAKDVASSITGETFMSTGIDLSANKINKSGNLSVIEDNSQLIKSFMTTNYFQLT